MNLSEIALTAGRKQKASGNATPVDIVTFVTAKWGLGQTLYPVQRIILKASYGLALDDVDPCVTVWDWRHENTQMMTEAEYLRYLYDNKRCNIREVIPGVQRRELVLAVGRRSGKTYLCACIAAYEIYKLLLKECPQDFYGLSKTNTIGVVSIATNKDQAKLLYDEASGHFSNCAFFHEFTANNTQSFVKFQTPHDIKQYGRYTDDPSARSSMRMTFLPCVASGIRGPGNIVIILDELAHFNDSGESDAQKVYTSVKPSLAAFSPKDPNNRLKELGPVEGRMISISSPLGRQGHFYNLFMQAMKGGRAAKNMLAIQAPTWEVNPSVEADFLEEMFAQDSVAFFTEFGAQFLDATRGWIDVHADLFACIDKTTKPITKGVPKRPYFLGVDIALVGDYSAVSVGHLDGDGRIVLDLMERIKAGEGQFRDQERLDFDAVADWIYNISRRFYIVHGIFDTWAGIPFEQALQKRGLSTIVSQMFTKPMTSQIFQNFKDMMWDNRIVLYDYPREEVDGETTKHCDYITELLELQATYHSQYVTTVEAPNVKGKHDDYSDALVRMVWLASQHLGKRKYIAGAPSQIPAGARGITPHQLAQAQRKARVQSKLGGTSPDRQRSRTQRGAVRGRH